MTATLNTISSKILLLYMCNHCWRNMNNTEFMFFVQPQPYSRMRLIPLSPGLLSGKSDSTPRNLYEWDFSLRQHNYNSTILNGEDMPMALHTRYLGLHFDRRLIWRNHIQKKRELQLRMRQMYWLFWSKSSVSLYQRKLLYLTILQSI